MTRAQDILLLEQGIQSLRAEARRLPSAIRDRRLLVSLALFAVLLILAAQAPFHATIEAGLEEGYGADLPLIADFHAPEQSASAQANFRWTTGHSLVRLPGAGQRPLEVTIRLLAIDPALAQQGPKTIEFWANGRLLATAPARLATGERYHVFLPPPPAGDGDQLLDIRSSTFTPAGDRRSIGVPVEQIQVAGLPGPVLPAWRSTLAWLAAASALGLALRRIGLTPRVAQAILLAAVLLASLAALLDPPRFAFGGAPALVVCLLGWLLVLLLTADPAGLLLAGAALALPGLAMAFGGYGWAAGLVAALLMVGWLRPALGDWYTRAAPLPAGARRWLLLFALIVLITHYGGKIYPDAMHGDIGFHTNRFQEVAQGLILILSRNRGVDFPYPPAFYLMLVPFALVGLNAAVLLQLGGALLNALSPFLIYAIVVGAVGWRHAQPSARTAGQGVIAAGIYAFTAATLMTTWWNFSTHIFTQFAHLLLIAVLIFLLGPRTKNREPGTSVDPAVVVGSRSLVLGSLVALQSFIYLGHFGFWINMSLLGAFGLAALTLAARHDPVQWRLVRLCLGAYVAAELFAVLFFYGAYTGLFIAQARTALAGGLSDVQNKAAADPAALWATLWDAGFRVHFGFFPVPLALCGLALLARRPIFAPRRSIMLALVVGTFLVALLFATLPFATRAALSTRWLMFSAWAIAVCAAPVVQRLWREGPAGRLIVLAGGAYVGWVTASMWLGALAWRIRPPEPF
jgi:hypothetical protein